MIIPTTQEGVELRRLTEEDAALYFDSVEASREHLAMFSDETNVNYPDLESVVESIVNPSNPDRLRFGIWDEQTFVGTINITPRDEGVSEIGYWLDARHTGHGYATLAASALAGFAKEVQGQDLVFAEVSGDNSASIRVLERSGFEKTSSLMGMLIYEHVSSGEEPSKSGRKISFNETERFERGGFSGNVFVDGSNNEGFKALLVDVHGRHPRKRILEGNTRSYFVVEGDGTFILNDQTHEVTQGDLFVIPAGSEYEYEGVMKLFEFNVSPDNSYGDEKLE